MVCWSPPFAMFLSTPLALAFSYYNSQNQKKFRQWSVKLLTKDLLLFWGVATIYSIVRTIALDPYCDPESVHYDKKLNAFERRKNALKEMKMGLEIEGKNKSE